MKIEDIFGNLPVLYTERLILRKMCMEDNEIAYALSRKYWGKGLMTEAVKGVSKFGFEKMNLNFLTK
jgi:hypothetical protein